MTGRTKETDINRRRFLQITTAASLLGVVSGASVAQPDSTFATAVQPDVPVYPPVNPSPLKITIFSPSGAVLHGRYLQRAARQLESMGVEVEIDSQADARAQCFAGTDDVRLQAIQRVTESNCDVALASRGGYGLSRLLDDINWPAVAQSVNKGKRWVGHSDFTAFQLALLTHTGKHSWAGPMAMADFALIEGVPAHASRLDATTCESFINTMRGQVQAAEFNTEEGFDGLRVQGMLWGGNLSVVCSMLATRHWPDVAGGILFLEDINERPSRIERMLLQLHHAGVLKQQKAILLGDFGSLAFSGVDKGYRLSDTIAYLRQIGAPPILTGLPFGHVNTKLTLPVGLTTALSVNQCNVCVDWVNIT